MLCSKTSRIAAHNFKGVRQSSSSMSPMVSASPLSIASLPLSSAFSKSLASMSWSSLSTFSPSSSPASSALSPASSALSPTSSSLSPASPSWTTSSSTSQSSISPSPISPSASSSHTWKNHSHIKLSIQRIQHHQSQPRSSHNRPFMHHQYRHLSASSSSPSTTQSASYDVVVVGGGPGGYVAAIKASQLGLKSACVEMRETLGGTCLNVGCIPSKALLNISHKYHEMVSDFGDMGIEVAKDEQNQALGINVVKMMTKKLKSVKGLTSGIEMLFKKNKVDFIRGKGRLISGNQVRITPMGAPSLSDPVAHPFEYADSASSSSGSGEEKVIEAKNIIMATGSVSSNFPGDSIVLNNDDIVNSTGALAFESVPRSILIIGGGVIGLELGSVWSRLGSSVQVVEFLDRLCPAIDQETAANFQKILEKQKMKFRLSTKVLKVERKADRTGVTVHVESVKDGSMELIEVEKVLVSVGRRPYTEGLGLEELGIELDKAGRVVVDEEFRVPKYPSIRAIGDLIQGPMLAHKAEEEGIACAELIANKGAGHVNYAAIPNVVYTHPEVSGIGKTEEELKKENKKYKKGQFPFMANSRARTNDDADGMVKILTDAENDKILGAWMIGPNAGELINELSLAMEYGASAEDVARTCHAHPTLAEAVKEACMAAYDKPIHC